MKVQYKDNRRFALGRKDEVNDAIAKEIAEEILRLAKQNIIDMNIETTGTLRRSGKIKKLKDGEYLVKFDAPYSAYVEFGVNSFTAPPPLGKLVSWVMFKFGYDKRTSFAIAKKIQAEIFERGLEPKPFLRGAVYSVQKSLEAKGYITEVEGLNVVTKKKSLKERIKEIIGRWLNVIS